MSYVTGRNHHFLIDTRPQLFFTGGNAKSPCKSGTRAACLCQCLRGDGQNADKSISMPGGKPHIPRLCPLAVGALGFQHKASGSGVELGSILHLWTFRRNLQGDCNSISVVTCQGLRVKYNQRQCFFSLDESPFHKLQETVNLILQEFSVPVNKPSACKPMRRISSCPT